MTTVPYNNTSPYYLTSQTSWSLDLWTPRDIQPMDTDSPFIITQLYNTKPDLLAYDLYGSTRLWWVFAVRNPDLIKDPIYDFVTGLEIMLPQPDTLKSLLGI